MDVIAREPSPRSADLGHLTPRLLVVAAFAVVRRLADAWARGDPEAMLAWSAQLGRVIAALDAGKGAR